MSWSVSIGNSEASCVCGENAGHPLTHFGAVPHGPFLFGTTDKLAEAAADLGKFALIVILEIAKYDSNPRDGMHAREKLSERLEMKTADRGLNLPSSPPK